MALILITLFCCLCLNSFAQEAPRTEATDSLLEEVYSTALARAFFESNNFDKALEAYENADTVRMSIRDLTNYAMSAFFKQEYQKTIDVALYGIQRRADHLPFYRLAFFSTTELHQTDLARSYARKLFCNGDSSQLYYYDYEYFVRYANQCSTLDADETSALKQSLEALIEHYTLKDEPHRVQYYRRRLQALEPSPHTTK